MTSYQKLRELRNQLLHDGTPPLEFGCEVETGVERTVLENRGETVITFAGGIRFSNKLVDLEKSGHWKIFGTPVTIAEVLVMLGKHDFENAPLLTVEGQLSYYNPETGSLSLSGIFVDLTKPLSEQEEACGALLELLSNK